MNGGGQYGMKVSIHFSFQSHILHIDHLKYKHILSFTSRVSAIPMLPPNAYEPWRYTKCASAPSAPGSASILPAPTDSQTGHRPLKPPCRRECGVARSCRCRMRSPAAASPHSGRFPFAFEESEPLKARCGESVDQTQRAGCVPDGN